MSYTVNIKAEVFIELVNKAQEKGILKEDDSYINLLVRKAKINDRITIDASRLQLEVLAMLYNERGLLSAASRSKVAALLSKTNLIDKESLEWIWETPVGNLKKLSELLATLPVKGNHAELHFEGRWYPVQISFTYSPARKFSEEEVVLQLSYSFIQQYRTLVKVVSKDFFVDFKGIKKSSLAEIGEYIGLRQPEVPPEYHQKRLERSEQLVNQSGCQFNYCPIHKSARKTGIYKVVVEADLEEKESRRDFHVNYMKWPLLRVFSLVHKTYMYVDVDDLKEYTYQKQALERLFLPNPILEMLHKIFSFSPEKLEGDIIDEKHGGMIILAHGQPGIGKTSTSEVYAEYIERPLYVLTLSELGTEVQGVEKNIQIVLNRTERWNAVLLLDEVDVFLTERDKDLNRSAVVGVFLRLMDYYRGIMFMTSNRAEVLDKAVRSRITLSIEYPELDAPTRQKIWEEKLTAAGILLTGDIEALSKIQLNGRDIRNIVRLAKIIFPEPLLDAHEIITLVNRTINSPAND
jgi:hypothetical protein